MLRSRARWRLREAEDGQAERLAAELGLDPLIARLLAARGIVDPEEARAFLDPGLDRLHDPFLLDGMDRAVDRIRLALDRGERIRIYGDYDADGVSSTSLMVRLMRRLGADFDYYIPHRVQEGYGLNIPAIEEAAAAGVRLIVTVDTGISAVEQVRFAVGLGIDVIVTDHHEPPEVLPDAFAVVNPKKPGCPYPFMQLAGVGVAAKLAHALLGEAPAEWLDLVALGTVADLMPLTGENRILVKHGLERLRHSDNAGLRALMRTAGLEPGKPVTATQVGFVLGPRINASGRLEHAGAAVRLLTTDNAEEATRLAAEMDELNRERQRIVDETAQEALALWEAEAALGRRAAVLAGNGWNVGVIGIVASKVLEKAYRPTVVLSVDPETGKAKGSARSIPGFDLYRALTECADLLEHYGGHQAAAGMTLAAENIPAFRDRLDRLAGEWLSEDDFVPLLTADLACGLEDVRLERILQLERLAPFGIGNPAPRFVISGVRATDRRTMGRDGRHMKLVLAAADETAATVEAVGFGRADALPAISPTARLDVLGEWSVNEWNGRRTLQIVVQDLRVPHMQVFDWRGCRLPEQLDERLRLLVDPSRRQAVLLFGDAAEDAGTLARFAAADLHAWAAAPDGRFVPLGTAASVVPWEDCEDLWLYDMPPGLRPLQDTLARWQRPERLYASFAEPSEAGAGSASFARGCAFPPPGREQFKALYVTLAQASAWNPDNPRHMGVLCARTGLGEPAVRFVLDVFAELGFVERKGGAVVRVPSPVKWDLTSSALYRRQAERAELAERLLLASSAELAALLESWLENRTMYAQEAAEADVSQARIS